MKYTKSQSAIDNLMAERERVTQENGTERPFAGPYDGDEKPGTYVDVVSEELLLASTYQEMLDRQLEGRDSIVDDHSIAEIATLGWVNALGESYAAGDMLGLSNYSNIQAWLGRGLARSAVQRGPHIPARPVSVSSPPIITTTASESGK